MIHGRHNTYKRHGCRCAPCRAANTAQARIDRASRAERLRSDPTLAEHGREHTYSQWGCRCATCRAAHRRHCRNTRGSASPALHSPEPPSPVVPATPNEGDSR